MTPDVAIVAMWLVWWISWMAAALWSDQPQARSPRWQIAYRALPAVGALLMFGISSRDLPRPPAPVAWTCAGLVAAGLLFTWWARVRLGRLWSSSITRKADHRVIDTGPYAIVRHPIYTGITLAAFATAAERGTSLSWVGAGVMTLGWVIKARMEEDFLREQLGADAYDDYRRRVPMLVPRLRSGRARR